MEPKGENRTQVIGTLSETPKRKHFKPGALVFIGWEQIHSVLFFFFLTLIDWKQTPMLIKAIKSYL